MQETIRHDLEEALTILWKETENNNRCFSAASEKLKKFIGAAAPSDLVSEGLIKADKVSDSYEFTEKGYRRAYDLARRHRLTERLLTDILCMDKSKVDTEACALEHIISKELEENICTLLGHPKVCPHGSPIMPGECCKSGTAKVERAIFALSELSHGERGYVSYIHTASHPFLHKLMALGLVPGILITVHQTFPAYVIEFEQTQLAIEDGVAANIFVRKIS
ncbi:MAG TPA: metal-dependent transcriptional regulator [Candidatus Wallbacteria bacterium]|nr:metal-dependent transcriptional regulator [Candidatus Wallbacteria bacterium]